MLGQIEKISGMNPWWFLLGAGAGVGIWYALSRTAVPKSVPGRESIAPVPSIQSPSVYPDLQAVARRLDEIKTLYRMDRISVEQAMGETERLVEAAYQFSTQEGERVTEVVGAIIAFQAELEDFIQFKRDNPEITRRAPTGPVTLRPPVIG